MVLGDAPETIDFATHVRPILNHHCISCHGGVKKSGGISFLFQEEALVRGKSDDYAIVPGKPVSSYLIDRITDSDDPMPPEDHVAMLSHNEVAILDSWIRQGAK